MPPTGKKLARLNPVDTGEKASVRHQRRPEAKPIDPRDLGTVGHDHKGDAVWNWHVAVPGRRSEDPTIDFLEALEVDGLSIEDESQDDELTATRNCNPYDHDR